VISCVPIIPFILSIILKILPQNVKIIIIIFTRTPTAPPALDATQQRPVDGLGSTQHIDIRIRGKVQSRKHVGDDEELIRCGQTIWGYGQRDSNLKKEYKKHFNFKINITVF